MSSSRRGVAGTGNRKELRALITLAGKVDPSLQAAMLKAANESKKCGSTISKAFAKIGKGIGSGLLKTLKSAGTAIVGLTVAAGVAFGAMAVQGLQYASDLTEVQNVVDKTFTTSAAVIDEFADTALEAYGLTKLEAKQYSSVIGSMLKSMGLSSEETLTMSQNLTALSGDMASFYNLQPEEAFEKIRAGIAGETEPLKQLGINMSVANMQAYAMSQGITTAYGSMSQSEQALLRYNYLLDATKDAQGDFSDTSGSFANQQKLMKASLQEVSGEIMQAMIPGLTSCMQAINNFLQSLDTAAIGEFVGSLGEMAAQFMPLVLDLLPPFGSLLGMLLPPLIELGQVLIPIVAEVVGVLMEALAPLIPIFMDIVKAILPPIAALLKAIMPLISGLASLLGGALRVAIDVAVAILQPFIDALTWIWGLFGDIGQAAGEFLNGNVATAVNEATAATAEGSHGGGGRGLDKYALGGFASKPSIFGEAGLEVAIPIRPGWERSKALLRRTAQLLGMGDAATASMSEDKYSFTYAPVLQLAGGEREELEPTMKRQYRQFRSMMEDFIRKKERYAW